MELNIIACSSFSLTELGLITKARSLLPDSELLNARCCLRKLQTAPTNSISTIANTSEFPILNEAQERKLKQLSILSLCSAGPTCLTYSHVQSTLSIPNTRTLEDLIISLIYASLLTGKLDTKSQLIEVSSCAGRDVSPSDLPLMVATLSTWLNQCETAVGQIDQQLAKIRDEAVRKGKDNEDYEEAVNKKRESLMKQETVEMGDKGGKGLGKGKRVISDSAEDAAESKGRGSVWDDEDVEMKFGEGGYTGSGEGLGESNQSSRRTKTRFGGSLLGGSKRR